MLISSWCKENLSYIQETQLTTDYYITINKIITRFLFSDVTIQNDHSIITYNMYDLSIPVLDKYIMELCMELSGSKLDYGREWKRLKEIGGFGHNTINMEQFMNDIKFLE